jgi:toluene monooxygenase system protein D
MSESERLVGPVIRGVNQDIAEALIEAIERDNPGTGVRVEDRGGYVRIGCPGRCVVTRRSLEDVLGETVRLSELEPALAGFAGRMRFEGDEAIVWYLERED